MDDDINRREEPACDMYARLKPFRCHHRSVGGTTLTSCQYHVTRGIPDQFLRSKETAAAEHAHGITITRQQLIVALKQARQRKVNVQ